MSRSLLGALASGTRQLLATQLFVSIAAVALAGWTLAVTNEVMRERDRLRERVVQLEYELAVRGIVVPSAPAIVTASGAAPRDYPSGAARARQTDAGEGSRFDPANLLEDLFAPAPPLRTLVLHAYSESDAELARRLGTELSGHEHLHVVVTVAAQRDRQQPGYVYYDGRQSRAAAAMVAEFNDAARRAEIPRWSAQPRGLALPATGEFTADRLDILLPALPAPPPASSPEPAPP